MASAQGLSRVDLGAQLLQSWASLGTRFRHVSGGMVPEVEDTAALVTLMSFNLNEGPRLSEEEARAALVVAVAQGWVILRESDV